VAAALASNQEGDLREALSLVQHLDPERAEVAVMAARLEAALRKLTAAEDVAQWERKKAREQRVQDRKLKKVRGMRGELN
jgi:ribosome-binding ATPase YchF (GTP1/OBG family)